MPEPSLEARLCAQYPAVAELPAGLRQEVIHSQASLLQLPAGRPLFKEGQACAGFPLVLSGEVQVLRGSPDGRSLELYRVAPAELCVASTTALFGQCALTAHGVTAAPTELLLLSPAGFERWAEHAPFRHFVFSTLGQRLAELMALVDTVAFHRLDARLAAALLGHGPVRRCTHQTLADELGTVREIVTRLLKRFERHGWVALGRERIEILDAAALRQQAAG